MASNQTANYGLNQWEATDKVERLDFNADNAKIDAALHGLAEGKAEQTALEALRNENLWVKVKEVKLTRAAAQLVVDLGSMAEYQAFVAYYSVAGPASASVKVSNGYTYSAFECSSATVAAVGKLEIVSGGAMGGALCIHQSVANNGYDNSDEERWFVTAAQLSGAVTITLKAQDNSFAANSSVVVYGLKKT